MDYHSIHSLYKVDTYFLHSPDPTTPISETLDTIQSLFLQKKFRHVRKSIRIAVQDPLMMGSCLVRDIKLSPIRSPTDLRILFIEWIRPSNSVPGKL